MTNPHSQCSRFHTLSSLLSNASYLNHNPTSTGCLPIGAGIMMILSIWLLDQIASNRGIRLDHSSYPVSSVCKCNNRSRESSPKVWRMNHALPELWLKHERLAPRRMPYFIVVQVRVRRMLVVWIFQNSKTALSTQSWFGQTNCTQSLIYARYGSVLFSTSQRDNVR